MLVQTSDLTRGEKILVLRRRMGETQAKTAKRLKLTPTEYRAFEADETEGAFTGSTGVGKLQEHEACYVARRRSGKTIEELATATKLCRWWISQMERGKAPAKRLTEYWAKRK